MLTYLQVWAAPLPVDPGKDPTALMAGWTDLADQARQIARRERARYILTSGYALTSLLNVYPPNAIPVIQFNERLRWIAFEHPKTSLFFSPGLYIAEKDKDLSRELAPRFLRFDRIGEIARRRDGKAIRHYVIYRAEQPVLPVLNAVRAEPTRSNSGR